MSRQRHHSTAELYVKLVVALGDAAMLFYFMHVHVEGEATVPFWIFGLLVSILGAMLTVDIARDKRAAYGDRHD